MYGVLDEVKDYCEIGIYFYKIIYLSSKISFSYGTLKSFQVDWYMFIIIMFIIIKFYSCCG